jgi:hypothetical protein
MGKAYCPNCKKILTEVLSSFECLAAWDRAEGYYVPGDDCKLVRRCPDCGSLTRTKETKIQKPIKKQMGEEDVRPLHFKKRRKRPHLAV